MVDSMKAHLAKYILKRRLDGGEFIYVYRPRGQSVAGKKAVWTILKSDEKIFNKLREASNVDSDEDFENLALKTIPVLPYEDSLSSDTNGDRKDEGGSDDEDEAGFERVSIPPEDLSRSVIVKNFPTKASAQECETFLRTFDSEMIMRREMGKNKAGSPYFKGCYCLIFSEATRAQQFLEQKDSLVFKEKPLAASSCQRTLQRRTVLQLHWKILSPPLAWAVSLLPEEKRDKVVFGVGPGKLAEERLTQIFCGLESEYENICAVKNVYLKAAAGTKYQFLQFEFNEEKSAEQFSSRLDKNVDGRLLSTITVREYQKQVELFGNANNLGSTDNIQKKILVVHNKPGMDVDTMFPSKTSVQIINIGFSKVSVVEFNTEKEATEAYLSVGDVPGGLIISLTDYLSLHAELKAQQKVTRRLKKLDRNLDNVAISGGETKLVLQDKSFTEKKVEVKVERSAKVSANKVKSEGSQTTPRNSILARRKNRGDSPWDLFVVVGDLRPKNKNLGTPNDMDICNYFLYNHRDVADVKFLSWTTVPPVVIVKFTSVPAAETFLGLEYVLFYGHEVVRNDVETFLKKKTEKQKEETSRLCLGQSYKSLPQPVSGGSSDCQVELTGLSSQAPELRSLFISQLHLAEKDVGKPQWEKAEGEKVKARFALKLEEGAVDFLVNKWNQLEIDVDGEKVLAELMNPKRGTKRVEVPSKGLGKKKKKKKVV